LARANVYIRRRCYLPKVKRIPETTELDNSGGITPGGTNHIPVIEVRNSLNLQKGSKGSKKIDLVAFKSSFFLLLELKHSYSYSDISKSNVLIKYPSGREAFLNALLAKGLLKSNNISIDYQQYILSSYYLIKAVGYNTSTKLAPEDFITFLVCTNFVKPSFGKHISNQVKALFTDLIHF
jgi:hypothetical protein